MTRKYDALNPFTYKVKIVDSFIRVIMICRRWKLKKSFDLSISDWQTIKRWNHTPYNIHAMIYRLMDRHISLLFSAEERLFPEYMNICMDAGKAIDKAFEANGVSA